MNTLGLLLPIILANPPLVPVQPPPPPGCVPVMTPAGVKLACPPVGPPAPVLATRVLAPAGTTVNYRPGSGAAKPAPAAAGLRPGYRYVLELDNLPGYPGRKIYPVVEVTGSLVPRASLNVLDFPTPILVTRTDIDLVMLGALVTKVVYLEDPTRAVPVDSTPETPLEFTELTVSDAVTAARENGRPVLTIRLGDRAPDAADLARLEVPGTVFLPGEPLAAAASAPVGPCVPVPLYDPILGPRPNPEECIIDGGDKGPRLGIGPDGRSAGGINPTDVSLAYSLGLKRKVNTSNEVCVCSPRFITRRVELVPAGVRVRQDLNVAIQATQRVVISNNIPAQEAIALVGLREVRTRLRPSVVVVTQGVAELVLLTTPRASYRLQGIAEVVGTQETDEITSGPNEIVVTKTVEPGGAVEPGQVVTITIRYRNATGRVATDLVLTDSLSGRLEFIPGSPQSDRPANVTRVPNAAGSEAVEFEIPGPVPPSGTGVVKFQAKVR